MIAAIELGILARLKAVSDSDALGYKYGTLETYPEDWDEYLKDKDGDQRTRGLGGVRRRPRDRGHVDQPDHAAHLWRGLHGREYAQRDRHPPRRSRQW
jgi:hypothetical protein